MGISSSIRVGTVEYGVMTLLLAPPFSNTSKAPSWVGDVRSW